MTVEKHQIRGTFIHKPNCWMMVQPHIDQAVELSAEIQITQIAKENYHIQINFLMANTELGGICNQGSFLLDHNDWKQVFNDMFLDVNTPLGKILYT